MRNRGKVRTGRIDGNRGIISGLTVFVCNLMLISRRRVLPKVGMHQQVRQVVHLTGYEKRIRYKTTVFEAIEPNSRPQVSANSMT